MSIGALRAAGNTGIPLGQDEDGQRRFWQGAWPPSARECGYCLRSNSPLSIASRIATMSASTTLSVRAALDRQHGDDAVSMFLLSYAALRDVRKKWAISILAWKAALQIRPPVSRSRRYPARRRVDRRSRCLSPFHVRRQSQRPTGRG